MLVSTFLDCAPSVFLPVSSRGSGAPSANLQLIGAVARIARILYGLVLPRRKDLEDLASVVTIYFMFQLSNYSPISSFR